MHGCSPPFPCRCPNATREYVGVMQNVYLQSCSPSAPLVSTDVWANRANLSTVAPYSGLTTWRMGPNPANASTTLWVTTVFDPFPMPNSGLLLPNVLNAQGVVAIRKRDNLVANSMVQVISSFLGDYAAAPPPPPPPSPAPPSPAPPPQAFATISTALLGQNALSVTRQVITLYNLTQRVNALADTTCYFPSNQAWALFAANGNDQGAFISVAANGTFTPLSRHRRSLLQSQPLPQHVTAIRFCALGFCATADLTTAGASGAAAQARRSLAMGPNPFNGSRFADTLTWNVTLEPADSYNRAIMRNVILQSCYNPPSAAGSQNAGANAVRRLVDTDEFAWETALGWGSSTGIVVQKTP